MTASERWQWPKHRVLGTPGSLCRDRDSELTSRLLAAAMLIPCVEALFGRPTHTPLEVPLALHLSILAVILLVSPFDVARAGRTHHLPTGRPWLSVPLLAVVFTALLNARSNFFYTGRVLMEGMAALFVLHCVSRRLRQRVLARYEVSLVGPVSSYLTRIRRWWTRRASVTRAPRTPVIRVADALTTLVGWSLLLSWLLIALEYRHPVGPILIMAGGLESVALIVLIPDALPVSRPAAWASVRPHARRSHPVHLTLVPGDALPYTSIVGAHSRRQS